MLGLSEIHFTWRDAVDIALVTYILYRIILLVRGTRAVPVIYGLVLIGLVYFLSGAIGFQTLHWLLGYFLGSILLIIIILFQDDIRKALSDVGTRSRLWYKRQTAPKDKFVNIIGETAITLASKRIGALMVFERTMLLGDIIERGVELDADISPELLVAIFYPGNPLHDGAVIIRGDKIVAARCVLPLSLEAATEFGTRHRAALGLAAQSDAVVLVISEERGTISMARGQTMEIMPNMLRLKQAISNALGTAR